MMQASHLVRQQGMSIYKAAKEMKVPWSSLKRYLNNTEVQDGNVVQDLPKLGRPFALPAELEVQIFNYIINMQELGFGLTVIQIRKLAFSLAETVGRKNFFMEEKGTASKWWWAHYKKRYGLTLRVPENLAAYRASMANPTILADFYTKLEALMERLNINNMPSRLWNCDETGLSFVVKPNKVVTALGKRYVYKRSYADRGETTTVLGCVCANGTFIPPLIIFKGVRWNPELTRGCLPNSLVKLSPKGWINSEIFLQWLQFFINAIPKERPVIVLMDSHASHISPAVIELAKQNEVHLFTFPAHTSHLLQPLDVGIYRPLKSAWNQSVNDYMREKNGEKPSRYNFNEIFTRAMVKSFSPTNIEHAFRKSGISPLNKNAIAPEAIAPAKFTETDPQRNKVENNLPDISVKTSLEETRVKDLLVLPSATSQKKETTKRKPRDSTAKCLTIPDLISNYSDPQPGCSGVVVSQVNKFTTTKTKTKNLPKNVLKSNEDDWECGVCGGWYEDDVKKTNGAVWVQCSFCCVPYHIKCQSKPDDEDVYMCDGCGGVSSDSD